MNGRLIRIDLRYNNGLHLRLSEKEIALLPLHQNIREAYWWDGADDVLNVYTTERDDIPAQVVKRPFKFRSEKGGR